MPCCPRGPRQAAAAEKFQVSGMATVRSQVSYALFCSAWQRKVGHKVENGNYQIYVVKKEVLTSARPMLMYFFAIQWLP